MAKSFTQTFTKVEKNVLGTNILAYFAAPSMAQKKTFYFTLVVESVNNDDTVRADAGGLHLFQVSG
jgi:hypothetical protein